MWRAALRGRARTREAQYRAVSTRSVAAGTVAELLVAGPVHVARRRPGHVGDDVLLELARCGSDDPPAGRGACDRRDVDAGRRGLPREPGARASERARRLARAPAGGGSGTRASPARPPGGSPRGTAGRRRRCPRRRVPGSAAPSDPRAPTAASPCSGADPMRWNSANRTGAGARRPPRSGRQRPPNARPTPRARTRRRSNPSCSASPSRRSASSGSGLCFGSTTQAKTVEPVALEVFRGRDGKTSVTCPPDRPRCAVHPP